VARIALTGGTGFVGQRLIPYLIAQGQDVRALTRRAQPSSASLHWVQGDLQNAAALERLCADCDAVIHLAGVIKGRSRADFVRGNVEGTAAMLRAAHRSGVRRFLHISSLAARAPQLSHYCSSKAEAEVLVKASGLDWTILRPPGVYGPGDRETLALFKAAKGPLMPIPAGSQRVSWIYIEDLCAAIEVALTPQTISQMMEVDDGAGGYSHRDFAQAVIAAVGGQARIVTLPQYSLRAFGYLNQVAGQLFRKATMLTSGKVREIFHDDWAVRDNSLHRLTDWSPAVSLDEGLLATVQWYKHSGWLERSY
jgi:nucleoside-diphosphate-sugar epimerase